MISMLKFLMLDKKGITIFSKQSRHSPGLGRNLIAANKVLYGKTQIKSQRHKLKIPCIHYKERIFVQQISYSAELNEVFESVEFNKKRYETNQLMFPIRTKT